MTSSSRVSGVRRKSRSKLLGAILASILTVAVVMVTAGGASASVVYRVHTWFTSQPCDFGTETQVGFDLTVRNLTPDTPLPAMQVSVNGSDNMMSLNREPLPPGETFTMPVVLKDFQVAGKALDGSEPLYTYVLYDMAGNPIGRGNHSYNQCVRTDWVSGDIHASAASGIPLRINILNTDTAGWSVTRVAGFSNGSAVVRTGAGGWLYYVSKPGFTGEDSGVYTVANQYGHSTTGSVFVTVKTPTQPASVHLWTVHSTIQKGQPCTNQLVWRTYADTLTASGGWSGSKMIHNGAQRRCPTIVGVHTYTLTASLGSGTPVTATTTITVLPAPPKVAVQHSAVPQHPVVKVNRPTPVKAPVLKSTPPTQVKTPGTVAHQPPPVATKPPVVVVHPPTVSSPPKDPRSCDAQNTSKKLLRWSDRHCRLHPPVVVVVPPVVVAPVTPPSVS